MAEPVTPIPADAEDDSSSRLPANAEDRKAAAALNALNANEISQGSASDSTSKQPSKADQEALINAMSRLETASGASTAKKTTGFGTEKGKETGKKEVEIKKKVKISSEDVALLMDELDMSKPKVTELLRAHDGDPIRAVKAFITPV